MWQQDLAHEDKGAQACHVSAPCLDTAGAQDSLVRGMLNA